MTQFAQLLRHHCHHYCCRRWYFVETPGDNITTDLRLIKAYCRNSPWKDWSFAAIILMIFFACTCLQKRENIDFADWKQRCSDWIRMNLLRCTDIFRKYLQEHATTMTRKDFVEALLSYSVYTSIFFVHRANRRFFIAFCSYYITVF